MKEVIVYLLLGACVVACTISIILHVKYLPEKQVSHEGDTAKPTDADNSEKFTALKKQYNVHGMDVSHWDGSVDWPDVKQSGIRFVFVKASEGTTYIDPEFSNNWSGAKQAGIPRGAYHFYSPTADPVAQANHFLKTVGHEKGDLLPVLDIETSGSVSKTQLSTDIRTWLETVADSIGRKPIIYTDNGFWEAHIEGDFSEYPLWIAEWENTESPSTLPSGWKEWAFWQYSASGQIDGINSKVDLNCFNSSSGSLKNYLIK